MTQPTKEHYTGKCENCKTCEDRLIDVAIQVGTAQERKRITELLRSKLVHAPGEPTEQDCLLEEVIEVINGK